MSKELILHEPSNITKVVLKEATITGPLGVDVACYIDPGDMFWFSTSQCATLLHYNDYRYITRLYERNLSEFTNEDANLDFVVNLTTKAGRGRPSRFFSLKGLIKLGTFSQTDVGANIREWASRLITAEIYGSPAPPILQDNKYPAILLASQDPLYRVDFLMQLREQDFIKDHFVRRDEIEEQIMEQLRLIFGRITYREPQRGELLNLSYSLFSFLYVTKGWTPDMFIYRFPHVIRSKADFEAYRAAVGAKPFPRQPALSDDRSNIILKDSIIKRWSIEELVSAHYSTKSCVEGALKRAAQSLQTNMDKYNDPNAQNIPYGEYLASNFTWKPKRNYYHSIIDACELCGQYFVGKGEFRLHHRHYKTVGVERLADLLPLCQRCHDAVHLKDVGHEPWLKH